MQGNMARCVSEEPSLPGMVFCSLQERTQVVTTDAQGPGTPCTSSLVLVLLRWGRACGASLGPPRPAAFTPRPPGRTRGASSELGGQTGAPLYPPDIVERWVGGGLTPCPLQAALPPEGCGCRGCCGRRGCRGCCGQGEKAGAAVPEPAVASVPVTCAAPGPPAALAATCLRRPPCLRQQRARGPPSRGWTPRESVREGGPSAVLVSPKLLRWTPSPRDGIGRGRLGVLRVRTALREPETGPHRTSVCTEIWD